MASPSHAREEGAPEVSVLWSGLAVALAAPLDVEVVVAAEALAHGAPERAAPLRVGIGEARVDGRLDDGVWVAARPQPLVGVGGTLQPPDVAARLAVGDRGLALALGGLRSGDRLAVHVDPDGLGVRWLAVAVTPDELSVAHCTAVGCAAVDEAGVVVRGVGAVREIGVPWSATGRPTSALEVALEVARGDQVGAWASVPAGPGWRAVALAVPAVRLEVQADCAAGRWQVQARARRTAAEGDWRWRAAAGGREIGDGEVRLSGEQVATWEVPWADDGVLAVALERAGLGGMVPAMVVHAAGGACGASLLTPVHRDVVRVAWRTPTPVRALPVEVQAPDGAVLGEAEVDLRAGEGELRVARRPGWPATVELVVGAWLRARSVRW